MVDECINTRLLMNLKYGKCNIKDRSVQFREGKYLYILIFGTYLGIKCTYGIGRCPDSTCFLLM